MNSKLARRLIQLQQNPFTTTKEENLFAEYSRTVLNDYVIPEETVYKDYDEEAMVSGIEDMILLLPYDEEKIIRMRFFEGMTQKKVGEILGKSDSMVSYWERRALCKLRNSHLAHYLQPLIMGG